MKKLWIKFASDDTAVTSIEYAILSSLIVLVIIVGVTLLGSNLGNMYNYVKDKVVLAATK